MRKDLQIHYSNEIKCSFCQVVCTDNYFDAATMSGRWAYMCPLDFLINGIGLGIGLGQHYVKGKKQPYEVKKAETL